MQITLSILLLILFEIFLFDVLLTSLTAFDFFGSIKRDSKLALTIPLGLVAFFILVTFLLFFSKTNDKILDSSMFAIPKSLTRQKNVQVLNK
jgi:hypothetical protein